MHQNWRDCIAWEKEGLGLQTTNNQTAKLFDVNLTKFVSMQKLSSFGGMEDMLQSDPDFVLGRVLDNAICFSGNDCSYDTSPLFKANVDLTFELANEFADSLTVREKLHLEALRNMKNGWKIKACDIYDQILQKYPSDFMALKLNLQCLLFLGQKKRMKESVEHVFKKCPTDNPFYHFLYADMSFAYCENGLFSEAEQFGLQGLLLYDKDIWATHALTHVYEMTGRFEKGIKFLDSTANSWQVCESFASHIHWHNALFNIEMENYDRAKEILDEEILNKRLYDNENLLSFIDASSLIYRLKLQGMNVTDNLEQFSDMCHSRFDNHVLPFNDLHVIFGLLGTEQIDVAEEMLESLENYVKKSKKDDAYKELTMKVAIPVGRSLVGYERGDYEGAAEGLKKVMEDILGIGGSDAQRDVFKQVFLDSAIQSKYLEHHTIAEPRFVSKLTA